MEKDILYRITNIITVHLKSQRTMKRIENTTRYILPFAAIMALSQTSKGQLILNQPNTTGNYSDPVSVTLAAGFGSSGAFSAFIGTSGPGPGPEAPFGNQNYIVTTIYRSGMLSIPTTPTSDQVSRSIVFLDGLGRTMQQVQWQGSPLKKDVVQLYSYDSFGSQSKTFLPYAELSLNDGKYKDGAENKQLSYYSVSSAANDGVVRTSKPFAETVFEKSPLLREMSVGTAGESWQISTNRTFKSDYGTNTASSVKKWVINGNTITGTTSYPANSLYRKTTYDENNPNKVKQGSIDEFKDYEDRLILKRVWKSSTESLDTYYIYDLLGNLRYIVPPAVTATSFTESDANFNNFVFGYRYDSTKRIISKKIPGKLGWDNMVYNKLDQVVLTQDSVQRAKKEWGYVSYDGRGRVASTGIYTNTNSGQLTLTGMQSFVNAHVGPQWESRNMGTAYANTTFPLTGANITIKELSVKYYDDYLFIDAGTLAAAGITQGKMIHGLPTAEKVTKDDGSNPMLAIKYYDDFGRIIQAASKNQLGGTDYTTNTYNFAGELINSKREHKASPTGTITTILTTNLFDHRGRIKETRKKLNSLAEIIQSAQIYNEIGQLRQKNLHVSGSSSAQQVEYSYNERGWMKSINDPTSVTDLRRFGMTLNYANKADAYNGNIGSIEWNTKVASGQTQTPKQTYTYSYDPLNRVTKAAYIGATGKANFYNEEFAYDKVGNIDSLRRSDGSTAWKSNFKYTYSGNRLSTIKDIGTSNRSNLFTYNANGNLQSDTLRKITSIEYNFLNLPTKFVSGAQNLLYSYDANGKKLTKTLGSAVTQYIDGIQYKNGVIEFIQTEEGRIVPTGSTFNYEYFVKDHLENTRLVIDNLGAVRQIQDYYAFGKEMNQGNAYNSTPINLYKYNGKEKQVELGLDLLDYGKRFYDSEIGRFIGVDPISEKFPHVSVYNYAENRPISGIDLWGQQYLDHNKARIYTANGMALLKVENLHDATKFRINSINRDKSKWTADNFGFDTRVSNVTFSSVLPNLEIPLAAYDNTVGATDPAYNAAIINIEKGRTKDGNFDKRLKDRTISGQGKYAPLAHGSALALNLFNQMAIGFGDLMVADDRDKTIAQNDGPLKEAKNDINKALNIKGMIPKKYRNQKDLSDILNVVLQGENRTEDKEIMEIGIRILKEISKKFDDDKIKW